MLPWLMRQEKVSIAEMAKQFDMNEADLIEDIEMASLCGIPPYTPFELTDMYIDEGYIYVGVNKRFNQNLRLSPSEAFGLGLLAAAARELPNFSRRRDLRSALRKLRRVLQADLVIGAVLVHGAKAPKLVSNELVSRMKHGSVLVDIAIDQGGCFEDSKPTTHAEPTFKVHNSIFYCVANMPGAVPVASTYALTNATMPYTLALANFGWQSAITKDLALAKGLNISGGKVRYQAVAQAHAYEFSPIG
jgi:hypothetical protein